MAPTKTWTQALDKLQAREKKARMGGGEARLQKLREKGMLAARERIDYILDDDSFI